MILLCLHLLLSLR
uniref:Uncharacterized protein n=1 Tax=Lepeophtheirus salmonis TaxID=72036 RepID=A0A0K2SYY4_LEPSM